MPNTPVPAAARGLPSFTRRAALGGLAALPALAFPERVGAVSEPASGLAELIADYRWKAAEAKRIDDEFDDAVRKNPNENITGGGVLEKLFNLAEQAANARGAAFDEILAYRPQSLEEYRLRDGFCAEMLVDGYEFFDCDLRMVFAAPKESSLPENKGVAWVERMRDSGYVFVCRGEPDASDLDNWGVRSDMEHGDDTDLLISLLKDRARTRAA